MQDDGGTDEPVKWVLDKLAHITHGLIAGAIWFFDPWLSGFLYLQFFLYEWVEETKIRDEMYHELKEWAIGFLLGLPLSRFIQIYLGLYP